MSQFKTFTYGKNGSDKIGFELTDEEMEAVTPSLESFTTKTQAIMYLHRRGWSTSAICKVIRYDDGRELLAPHVNQVRAKARAIDSK